MLALKYKMLSENFDRAERHAFWSRFLLIHSPCLLPSFFRRENNNQSRGEKSCLSARSLPKIKQKGEFVYWMIYKFVVISIKFQFQWVLHSNKQFKHFQFASKNNSCRDLVHSTKIVFVHQNAKYFLYKLFINGTFRYCSV